MIAEFARVMDRQRFLSLVDKVFVDGISWGKIVTLICVVGKAIAKVGLSVLSLPIGYHHLCVSVPKV